MSWTDEPDAGDGWYWVTLRHRRREKYMVLVYKGRHVSLFKADGSIGSGGSIDDVRRAGGRWQRVPDPIPENKRSRKKEEP